MASSADVGEVAVVRPVLRPFRIMILYRYLLHYGLLLNIMSQYLWLFSLILQGLSYLWLFSLKTFSISSVQFLQSVRLHLVLSCVYAFYTLSLSSFHHDDYACVLLCLLLSTYSTVSSSPFRNFLTSKFLGEEFIKIAYSPPPPL